MDKEKKSGMDGPGRWTALVIALVMLCTGSCAMVGPDYSRPETTLSPGWSTPLKQAVTEGQTDPQTLASWWSVFGDSTLSSLMERAVRGNLDLKEARARVKEARARRGIARADLFPAIDASGSMTASGSGKDANLSNTAELYRAAFDATWEIDIFGGVRRSIEAQTADLRATEEDLRDVLVTLLAEVALNYIDGRTYQARLAVAEANLKAQEETWQLARWRYEAGLSDELAVQQARYNLESTRSQTPTLRTGIEEAMNRVAVLLGEQPGAIRSEMEKVQSVPKAPASIAVGVPADVLRRRPDVRKAEAKLAAETARIGVAKADLYPRLVLKGSVGTEALSFGKVFSSSSRAFSYGPQITWPIFNAGSIRKNIEAQTAVQEQTLIQYEASVLTALEDVENAIVAFGQEQLKRQSLGESSDAARLAVTLAEHKYTAGLTDFTGVLDAQRSLLTYQDQTVQSDGAIASNLVRLYKALGGGWTTLAPDTDNHNQVITEKKE